MQRNPDTESSQHDPFEIVQERLVSKLSDALGVEPEDLNTQLPFASFGLDSLTAFSLTGDLAYWLGHELPATLLWEYPTIESLADYLLSCFLDDIILGK